ncbi:phage tail sheath family protein [Mesorhizobium sp. B1-1-9]|uniref:phage tail sheath family protein n=1 Tax=Mesorhizobium sp. B1-1-9 TaxID=2589975 RepID=UPI001125EC01|nr:phage tail sheath subtilisin-like domain-containing protein [Mesorhizobium sp. B1-1-9]TPN48521.1 phage tail sheath family protein [Mesorhizobium sp. B1-1-9]
MPIAVNYPGVYVEEISSGVHTITGVATSITAFVGRTRRGPLNDPVRVQSYAEFERTFGGLWSESTLSYAVAQFFQNGGGDALIVRVAGGAGLKVSTAASVKSLKYDPAGPASAGTGAVALDAASSGIWGDALWARIEPVPGDATNKVFNLTVLDNSSGTSEQFLNLSTDPAAPRFVTGFLEQNSNLVRVNGAVPATLVAGVVTDADANKPAILDPKLSSQFTNGSDGDAITDDLISKVDLRANKQGIWALEKADLFNLLCIPPLKADTDIGLQTRDAAAAYCKQRRALLIVDPLIAWNSHSKAIDAIGKPGFMARNSYAALFFPFVRAPDPELKGQIASFAPCGAVAGIFARTDAARGVWKAPAGLEATISGVAGLAVKLTDGENGQLNPLAINCLRSFPNFGTVVWGSRTLDGADQLASEWKYIPVRRLALFIEESLFRGTQWVVFEPNDEPLWAQIRLNIGAFMHNLFRQGAFQGATPTDAYFVKCDKDTTTQNDINLGIVNIVVGFAPLKPAEFVIIKIQQIAGDIAT